MKKLVTQPVPWKFLNKLLFLFSIVLFNSCQESVTPPEVEDVFTGEPYPAYNTAKIDTSDLHYLPQDTGGEQKAFPLGSTEAVYGHFVYTPSGYEEDTSAYPLMLFMHGYGERGDSRADPNVLNRVKAYGPPRLITGRQWKPSYPFIVASPQLVTEYWEPDEIHKFIEYIIEKYRINKKRIYVTGLSQGGGGAWYYVGERDDLYAAAIVPISASGAEHLTANLAEVPIWAFHGDSDDLVDPYANYGSVTMVAAVNAAKPKVAARVSLYVNTAHNAWTRTYENRFVTKGINYDSFEMNIYDWMLQYRKE